MYQRDRTFADGPGREAGPDLIVGYAKGVRASDDTSLGRVPRDMIVDNLEKWSGDHIMDHEAVPGVLLSSRPLVSAGTVAARAEGGPVGRVRYRRRATRNRRRNDAPSRRYGAVPEAGGATVFGSSVKLDKDLLRRVRRYADIAGYSSVEEFITHALEKELAVLEDADSEEEVRKRLQGLGYIS